MSKKNVKMLWNPRVEKPHSVTINESTWLLVKSILTINATSVILKAGTKEYALEAGDSSVGGGARSADRDGSFIGGFTGAGGRRKISELLLKRRYR